MQPTDLRTLTDVLRGDLAPSSTTAATEISERPHARLVRYGTDDQYERARAAGAVPVLLVPPPAVPAWCYDLAPGVEPANSVVEFLISAGTVPYVVDFGDVSRADRHIGFETYFDHLIPRAIAEVVDDFAGPTDALDLMAWSLGGTLSFLTAANDPGLPIRSIITIGTPLNYMKIAPYPLLSALLKPTGGRPFTYLVRALAGVPAPAVRLGYKATAWQRELRKPLYILQNLNDREALARMQVIDRFQDSLPGYPGRLTEQMLVNLMIRNEIAHGTLRFDRHTVDVSAITAPVFMVGSHRDAIVPHAAAEHGLQLFGASEHVEFHTVEASHLGLLTGDTAARQTWPAIAAFRERLDAERLA